MHDAYNIGDKVIYESQVYESLINANTWNPAALIAAWFAFTTGELWLLAGIRKNKLERGGGQ